MPTPRPFETSDIKDQNLGNIEIIEPVQLDTRRPSPVKYVVPPEIDVIGVNAPKYDCCVQKVIDEMGKYINIHKMQFVLGNDMSPQDIIPYFPKYVLYFRSGTVPGTPEGIIGNLTGFLQYYRKLGLPVYYYLDDYLLTMNNSGPARIMQSCDGIIVSTNALKDTILEQYKYTVPIHVLKTHIDLVTFDMLQPLPGIRKEGKLNVFFSSQGRIGIKIYYEIAQKMNEKPELYRDVHLVALSHQVAQVRSLINNCRNIQKSYLEWLPLDIYYKLAASMDVIIAPGMVGDLDYMMPRELQQLWLDCKSAHKYTLAGAAGVPCIASPLSDYKEAIKHGETGFIASTVDEWMEYINILLHDHDFRKKMGTAARKDIIENWNLYKRMEEFVGILKGKDKAEVSYELAGEVRKEIEAPNIIFKKNPKVMVFIPVHNGLKYIRECLDSCLAQTYTNQEIIISDNGSTDGTREMVKKEYPMAKLYEWDYFEMTNPGYNQAVKDSTAEFFVELGHDDRLEPNFWEEVLPYFLDAKVGFVRVGCYQFSDKNPDGSWWKPVPWINPLDILIQNKVLISSPRRRSAVLSIGDGDYNCFFGDWDNWIRLVLAGWKWTTCQKPLFWYRRHPSAMSFNYDARVDGPAYTYMRKKWLPTVVKYGLAATSFALPEHIAEYKKAISGDKLDFKENK